MGRDGKLFRKSAAPLGAVPPGNDVIDLADVAGIGFLKERFDSGSGGLVHEPGYDRPGVNDLRV
jgi:hypothetical protein